MVKAVRVCDRPTTVVLLRMGPVSRCRNHERFADLPHLLFYQHLTKDWFLAPGWEVGTVFIILIL